MLLMNWDSGFEKAIKGKSTAKRISPPSLKIMIK